MKRIIPFWTFMSRNLPLQIQEQWTNPRVYTLLQQRDPATSRSKTKSSPPTTGSARVPGRTPLSIGGMPIVAQPDLGHTRVQQDIEMMSDACSVEGASARRSPQTNPLIGGTIDYACKRDSFYDRTFTSKDFKKMSGPVGTPITWLAKRPGQTNERVRSTENLVNLLTSLAPTAVADHPPRCPKRPVVTRGRTWTKRARYGGVPAQLLTPAAQESEYWRQYYEMKDEAGRLQAMVEEAAS